MLSLDELYKRSPYAIQHIGFNLYAGILHHKRYGTNFKKIKSHIDSTEHYSSDEIKEYQYQKLMKIFRHSYESVPFYRRKYSEIGIHPEDIKSLEDMENIPLITKEDIKKYPNEFISERFKKSSLVHGHTSGTTGAPLNLYWDEHTSVFNNALDWRQKSWGGITIGDKIAVFLGRTIVSPSKKSPPFWQLDRFHNMMWFSSFHLSDDHIDSILNTMKEFSPKAIEGYPSTISIIAKYALIRKIKIKVQSVFTSSEPLLDNQKSVIEEAFSCEVFDFYGMAERVVFATQCAKEHNYHLNFELAYNEIVSSDGNVMKPGERGYVVGTSLTNYAMPLIRYRTNDISSISEEKCSCGIEMDILDSVATKEEDIIVTKDGKMISSSALTHPFKPITTIVKSQIVQTSLENITIKVVCGEGFSNSDISNLVRSFKDRVGHDMNVEVVVVEDIPRTENGKFRWLISKVKLPI
jgi:phenylacetate-CoA ligase